MLAVLVLAIMLVSICEMSFGAEKKKQESTKVSSKDTKGKSGPSSARAKERQKAAIAEYVEWLQENYPQEAAKLKKVQANNPDIYIRHALMSRSKYGKIMEMQKKNPALAEIMKEDLHLNKRRFELVGKIKKAKGKDAEKLKKELEKVVSARFDLLVKKKQLQYESLERRIELLKKQIARQKIEVQKLKDNKPQATKERMEELLSNKEKVKWNK